MPRCTDEFLKHGKREERKAKIESYISAWSEEQKKRARRDGLIWFSVLAVKWYEDGLLTAEELNKVVELIAKEEEKVK